MTSVYELYRRYECGAICIETYHTLVEARVHLAIMNEERTISINYVQEYIVFQDHRVAGETYYQ